MTWTSSSEFGTHRLCEQRRFRRACASAQSRQNLRCSLIQAVSEEEPSNRKPDPLALWIAGHTQLKFVMTECSKTQIRLTGPTCYEPVQAAMWCKPSTRIEQPGLSVSLCIHVSTFSQKYHLLLGTSKIKRIMLCVKTRKINHQIYFCLETKLELSAKDFICQILRFHLKSVLLFRQNWNFNLVYCIKQGKRY